MKNYKLLLFVAFITSGCVIFPTAEKYNLKVQKYVGLPVSNLENTMGYPSRKTEAFNGDAVYIYDKSSSYTTPTKSKTTYTPAVTAGSVVYVPASSKTKITGGQTYHSSCSTYFTINKTNGIIKHVRFEGNACKSR